MSTTAEQLLAEWPDDVLSQAARGEIDLNEAAHWELVSRGKNASGEYVGREAAMTDWQDVYDCQEPIGDRLTVKVNLDSSALLESIAGIQEQIDSMPTTADRLMTAVAIVMAFITLCLACQALLPGVWL